MHIFLVRRGEIQGKVYTALVTRLDEKGYTLKFGDATIPITVYEEFGVRIHLELVAGTVLDQVRVNMLHVNGTIPSLDWVVDVHASKEFWVAAKPPEFVLSFRPSPHDFDYSVVVTNGIITADMPPAGIIGFSPFFPEGMLTEGHPEIV